MSYIYYKYYSTFMFSDVLTAKKIPTSHTYKTESVFVGYSSNTVTQ